MKFKFFRMTCPPHPFTPYWLSVPWPIYCPHSGGRLLMLKQASFPSSCLRGSSVPGPRGAIPQGPSKGENPSS
uniref:Uncharacterized protein n=1 Tax=Piliocolobus tephrosceles TaxID=591936 RepID=A0A8C9LLT4_9PRIM